MNETHLSFSHCPWLLPPRLRFPLGICCQGLALSHQCLLLLHHTRPWLLKIEIWISMCVCVLSKPHPNPPMSPLTSPCSTMVIGNRDLDFNVCVCARECVCERERERVVKAYSILVSDCCVCWILCLISKKVQ